MNLSSHLSCIIEGSLPIAFFSAMYYILLHFCCYSVVLNLIYTTYTLSPSFPNCLSSLQQMKPMPSQVTNHYSQMNPEAHLERSLAYNKAADLHYPSNAFRPIICLCAADSRVLMSLHWLMKQDDATDQEIGEDDCEDTRESTQPYHIEEDNLDRQLKALHLDQSLHDKSLRTTRIPLPKTWTHANTVIPHHPLPNSPNPAGAITLPQLKCQQSTILNELSESDLSPSAQVLPLCMSSGDLNVPQPKARGDQNVPQHQKATFGVAKRYMEFILLTKTPWPILPNDKYLMVEESWKLAIEAQDCQRALAGTPVCTPSGGQLPSAASPEMDLQTWDAVRLGYSWLLLYQIYNIDYALRYT